MNELDKRGGETHLEYFRRLRPTATARYAAQKRRDAKWERIGDWVGGLFWLVVVIGLAFLNYTMLTKMGIL